MSWQIYSFLCYETKTKFSHILLGMLFPVHSPRQYDLSNLRRLTLWNKKKFSYFVTSLTQEDFEISQCGFHQCSYKECFINVYKIGLLFLFSFWSRSESEWNIKLQRRGKVVKFSGKLWDIRKFLVEWDVVLKLWRLVIGFFFLSPFTCYLHFVYRSYKEIKVGKERDAFKFHFLLRGGGYSYFVVRECFLEPAEITVLHGQNVWGISGIILENCE